jgi:hypothetical protein
MVTEEDLLQTRLFTESRQPALIVRKAKAHSVGVSILSSVPGADHDTLYFAELLFALCFFMVYSNPILEFSLSTYGAL